MTFIDLMSYLLYCEATTQKMHWKSKSFARHVALGDMYEAMVDLVDEMNEIWLGKYGNDTPIPTKDWNADMSSEKAYVDQMFATLESFRKQVFHDGDDYIENKFEELQAIVARAKYKIDNLS